MGFLPAAVTFGGLRAMPCTRILDQYDFVLQDLAKAGVPLFV